MKLLFLGDIVGSSGRNIVAKNLAKIKEKHGIDFTIVNGENAAHGKGITSRIYHFLKELGVDVITLGNHSFSKSEIMDEIDNLEDLIRPANLDPIDVGYSYVVKKVKDKRIAVINLCGEAFMNRIVNSPVDAMNELLPQIEADLIFVDFHGEATAEKILFSQYFKDQCIAVVGTHTHVQTADERIVSGCAMISDVGMCGAYDSVIGRDVNEMIDRIILNKNTRFTVAEGPAMLCGVVIEIDESTNRAISIERIQIRPQFS